MFFFFFFDTYIINSYSGWNKPRRRGRLRGSDAAANVACQNCCHERHLARYWDAIHFIPDLIFCLNRRERESNHAHACHQRQTSCHPGITIPIWQHASVSQRLDFPSLQVTNRWGALCNGQSFQSKPFFFLSWRRCYLSEDNMASDAVV